MFQTSDKLIFFGEFEPKPKF